MMRSLLQLVLVMVAAAAVMVACESHGMRYEYDTARSTGHAGYAPHRAAAEAAPAGPAAAFGPADEVWIIAKPPRQATAAASDDTPGSGAMLALVPPLGSTTESRPVPMPLRHTDVRGDVAGFVATVDVTQRFENPFDTKIEAVYVFPLPEDAAITGFVMTVGDRRIRGIVREREEAERTYAHARSQGYRASLLTQERPNVFTQKVANLEPGRGIDVSIRYFHTLAYSDGWYTWTFPMVVGPRFNPPGTRNPIHATTPQGAAAAGPGETAVPYLRPGERSGHDVALSVRVDAGVPIEAFHSVNHRVWGDPAAGLSLAADDTIPNKDFVLRFRVAGDRMKAGLLTHRDARTGEGYFTLMLYPPTDLTSLPRRPVELLFVLDCSGSMHGEPLRQAKAAVRHALRQLQPDDTFGIIRFSDDASALFAKPQPATPRHVGRALDYVDDLEADGGTMMLRGVRAALDAPRDRERLRFVLFLTDGFIGNEDEVLAAVDERIGDARIFSVGIGSSPNRYLLHELARVGRGVEAYLALNEDPEPVVDRFLGRVRHPAMTDLAVDWRGLSPRDVYPSRVPDLFVGRPVVLTGRFDGEPPSSVVVTGRAGGETLTSHVDVTRPGDHPALAAVWARRKIADLADDTIRGGDPLEARHAITRVALDHGLVSPFTAFLAVDASERTAGSYGVTVPQAVPVPAGVRYDTTVAE